MNDVSDEHKVIDFSYPLLFVDSDAKVIHEITRLKYHAAEQIH